MNENDEHVIEALGKARIVVKKGKVVEVGEPKISYCPLFEKYRGISELSPEVIKENIEFRIEDFGMCTPQRTLRMKDFLSFGVSETLSTLLEDGIIDCTVIVCEGCGTVIVTDPELVQGIGGRISGFVSTSPIEGIINTLGAQNVLDPENAAIDQVAGVLKAIKMGYKDIAVTIAGAEDVVKLREIEKENEDVNIYIFAVHVSEISKEDAEILFQHADVITACASKHVRKIAEEREIFSVGASIPIYGVTEDGKEFMLRRIRKIGGLKDKKDAKAPEPLI
ncbi:MAG TPA: methanogenesis marker 8 protein [Methanobacterium sp.]